MEKEIVFNLINELRLESFTATRLATMLRTNHMAVIRAAKQLVEENVLDTVKEGRNKLYSLKTTLEAKNYLFMAELYKLNKLIKKYPAMRRIVGIIQNDRRIKLAVLFGSYADFSADKTSDIDIFIEGNNTKIREEIEGKDSKASVKIGGYVENNSLIKEIWKKHIILKGVEVYYEKTKFFGKTL
jgi:predicted nucleotidyltransferase